MLKQSAHGSRHARIRQRIKRAFVLHTPQIQRIGYIQIHDRFVRYECADAVFAALPVERDQLHGRAPRFGTGELPQVTHVIANSIVETEVLLAKKRHRHAELKLQTRTSNAAKTWRNLSDALESSCRSGA